jgi:hypothetical protein
MPGGALLVVASTLPPGFRLFLGFWSSQQDRATIEGDLVDHPEPPDEDYAGQHGAESETR